MHARPNRGKIGIQLTKTKTKTTLSNKDHTSNSKFDQYETDDFLVDLRGQLNQVQEKFKEDPNAKYGNRHPEELKAVAIALRSSGMPYEKIAFVLKVGSGSVHAWVNSSSRLGGRYHELAETVKNHLADKQYLLSNTILGSVSDADIERASLKDKILSSSILIDKARLIDGESTENQAVYIKKSVEIRSSIQDDKERLKSIDAKIALLEAELAQ